MVTDDIAALLKSLPAAQYYLVCRVDVTTNYTALEPQPIPFSVLAATNSWNITPSVNMWTEGKYKAEDKHLQADAAFGEAHIKVVSASDPTKIFFDSDKGIDNLAKAKAGQYTLIAWVEGSSDYSALVDYTFNFQIFKKAGLPWWGALLVAVGAIGVAALVLLILYKKGVFQLLTEKVVVAIRTRANVEATIASVRAAKMMEEGRQSVADAKRRERIEKMRQKAAEKRAMSPEERAAELEQKAQAEAARAAKLRERSEATLARVEKMRSELPETPAKEEKAPETPVKEEKAPEAPAKEEKAPETPVKEEKAPEAPAKEEKAPAAKSTAPKKAPAKKAPAASKGASKKPETPTEK